MDGVFLWRVILTIAMCVLAWRVWILDTTMTTSTAVMLLAHEQYTKLLNTHTENLGRIEQAVPGLWGGWNNHEERLRKLEAPK